MKDNRVKYNDCWYEDEHIFKYRSRRNMRHYERDFKKLIKE